MRTRKRYYSTTTGHAAGFDIAIRTPDGRVIAKVTGVALYDDGSGADQARADARLIVEALNGHAKGKG